MPNTPWDIQGKIVLVTGASSGIGKATATELARQGANVVLLCRNRSKGESTVSEIHNQVPQSTVELVVVDLASLGSLRSAAHEVITRFPQVDVLINNAGLMPGTREISEDGFEMQFAVNHLAPFTLTNLLLSHMKKAAAARIVTVSSEMHQGTTLNFDDLQSERDYARIRTYKRSKLANVLFTYELARRLAGTRVTANCLHPGVVATDIIRDLPFPLGFVMKAAGAFMLTPEKGARTSVYLATAPELSSISGKYFISCKEKTSSKASHDASAAKRLWDISAQMAGLQDS